MTLDEAEDAFRTNPTKDAAKVYGAVLSEYFEDEMIGRDTYRLGMAEVIEYLSKAA